MFVALKKKYFVNVFTFKKSKMKKCRVWFQNPPRSTSALFWTILIGREEGQSRIFTLRFDLNMCGHIWPILTVVIQDDFPCEDMFGWVWVEKQVKSLWTPPSPFSLDSIDTTDTPCSKQFIILSDTFSPESPDSPESPYSPDSPFPIFLNFPQPNSAFNTEFAQFT